VSIPADINESDILFRSSGYFMGGSISQPIRRIIYVRPKAYEALELSEKYDLARLVGALNRTGERADLPTLLLGPGRWGTTTPSLGVPVSFSEINNIAVLAELACEGTNLMPELSFGTHFFQDLVESDIFYVAIFPQKEGCTFNESWFENIPNALPEILPEKAKYKDVLTVCELRGKGVRLVADVVSQKLVCFLESPSGAGPL